MCPTCQLTGHRARDCEYSESVDGIVIDWLHIFLSTGTMDKIDLYLRSGEITIDRLRVNGMRCNNFDSWNAVQTNCGLSLLQLRKLQKCILQYHKDRKQEFLKSKRELDRKWPVNFAFTTDYSSDSVPKCPECKTWLFPQELGRKQWCCEQGEVLRSVAQLKPIPDDTLQLYLMDKEFQRNSRKYNGLFCFASFGIQYGRMVKYSQGPPHALKLSGWIYERVMHADVKSSPLHYYIHDAQLRFDLGTERRLNDSTLRTLDASIRQNNILATYLTQLGRQYTHDQLEEMTIHLKYDASLHSSTASSEMAAILTRPSNDQPNGRTIVIHPTNATFYDWYPALNSARNENGTFVDTMHGFYENLMYPLFFTRGLLDSGWALDMRSENTVLTYTRFRQFCPELIRDPTTGVYITQPLLFNRLYII
jgi:hypothetical protein